MKERLHPVMFAGTGSDVGKSIIATAFCRIFRQDGYTPAPFKAQNMALNSFATPDGREIGRAQAVQAEAAGIPCHTDMNPLLLKPQSDHTSQVVLNGKPIGNRDAYDYFRKEGREELREAVHAAYDRLAARHNPIVMEGAGSLAEINLRDTDLVNVPMAMHFENGRRMLEELCGIPVLGVVPYYHDIHIEEEDSVALAAKSAAAQRGKINVAVVLLRHISNFTDFNVLEQDPRVHLFYSNNVEELAKADILILPGSKSTLDDLYEIRRNGVAQAILRARREGATVLGICGGYQMMGQQIRDPHHVEGAIEAMPGLGLLPMVTEMLPEKVTRQVHFTLADSPDSQPMEGYEIHMGETCPTGDDPVRPLNLLEDGKTDGCFVDAKCMGSYIHGILDNPAFIDRLLEPHNAKLDQTATTFDYHAFKETQYDRLADHVRKYVNVALLYDILKGKR